MYRLANTKRRITACAKPALALSAAELLDLDEKNGCIFLRISAK
jgi:hypothetical protein